MRSTLALAACLAATTALACDDHNGECEVETWRSLETFGSLCIDGIATCDSGTISIRLYGEDSQYLGNALGLGFIDGHVFSAIANDVMKPANLTIKYSIDAE